ncbi:MAG: hypothetical protein AB7U81_04830 [Thiohalomonadaceae bacterium]
MSGRSVLWIRTDAGRPMVVHERLKNALRNFDCKVIEVNAGDVERLLDAMESGAVPVVVKEPIGE